MQEHFMRRCLGLAQLGAGQVSPNPMVGAVIVHENRIIGEGWHEKYGGPHAEVNAVASVVSADRCLLKKSTIYVSLEPCNHFGQTPPCVDLILNEGIPKVVVCCTDSNPLVGGKGIERLRAAGLQVELGLLETEGLALNAPFFTWMDKKRPYIILKWAQSQDGFMARRGERTNISSAVSRRLVHQWRAESDAILVGTETVLVDNPRLDTRYWNDKPLLRVFFDTKAKIPMDFHIFDDSMPTWCLGPNRSGNWEQTQFFLQKNRKNQIPYVLKKLSEAKKAILFVEGGAATHHYFLKENLWDEIRVVEGAINLGDGVAAPVLPKGGIYQTHTTIGSDTIRIIKRTI